MRFTGGQPSRDFVTRLPIEKTRKRERTSYEANPTQAFIRVVPAWWCSIAWQWQELRPPAPLPLEQSVSVGRCSRHDYLKRKAQRQFDRICANESITFVETETLSADGTMMTLLTSYEQLKRDMDADKMWAWAQKGNGVLLEDISH